MYLTNQKIQYHLIAMSLKLCTLYLYMITYAKLYFKLPNCDKEEYSEYLNTYKPKLPHPIKKQIVFIMPKNANWALSKNENFSQMFNCLDCIPYNKYRYNDTNIIVISTNDIRLNNIDICNLPSLHVSPFHPCWHPSVRHSPLDLMQVP